MWELTLNKASAVELERRIRSGYPHFSPIHLIKPGVPGGYIVQIVLYRFEYSQYEGIEYDDFVRVVEANGFVVDIPRTELLILPKQTAIDITTPGQWELFEMTSLGMSDEQAITRLREYDGGKPGRPSKLPHVA